jgi:hypothetical protein
MRATPTAPSPAAVYYLVVETIESMINRKLLRYELETPFQQLGIKPSRLAILLDERSLIVTGSKHTLITNLFMTDAPSNVITILRQEE